MTGNQITSSPPANATMEGRLKDLEEENELLLLQLHQVQEELEAYFLKCQALEKGGGISSAGGAITDGRVDDELPQALTEAARLAALVEAQKWLQRIQTTNSLNARLGDILIRSVSPSGSLAGLPAQLLTLWRASKAEQPPAILGEKNFDKVISTYTEGGLAATSQLLSAVTFPEMRAKAYTALARHQMEKGLFVEAAESARCAYEDDPRPYRLKWLAFRLHEAGEIIRADAILSLLPQDLPFSDSESRQREQVRYEAENARLEEAKQRTGFESRRNAVERQMATLRQDRDKQAGLVAERQAEIKALKKIQVQLKQDVSTLMEQREELDLRAQQLETGKADRNNLLAAREKENEVLLAQLHEVQEELERCHLRAQAVEQEKTRLVEENSALEVQRQAIAKLSDAFREGIEVLKRKQVQLEHENSDLVGRHGVQERMVAECESRIERLQQSQAALQADCDLHGKELKTAKALLEQERVKSAAATEQLEQQQQSKAALEAEHGRETAELQLVHAKLEQEKLELSERYEELARLSTARDRQLEALKAGQARLKQELSELAVCRDDQAKFAAGLSEQLEDLRQSKGALEAEHGRETAELQLVHAKLEQEKSELSERYEELVGLSTARDRQLEELKAGQARLEQELSELAVCRDDQAKFAAGLSEQLEDLRQSKGALEAEHGRETVELQLVHAKLEQEKLELSLRLKENAIVAAEKEARIEQLLRSRAELEANHNCQIEELTTAKLQLNQEKSDLAIRHDEQAKLAAERLKQLSELQPQIQNRLEAETELSMRQQAMQEELIRAEAQLDLIKDIILKEPGL